MKKLVFVLLLALCMVCTVCAVASSGYIRYNDDFFYEVQDDRTVKIRGYLGSSSQLTIPTKLGGLTVTSIGEPHICSNLTSVTIPDSVTFVEARPFFALCESLTKVIVSPTHPTLTVVDGALISKPDKRLVWYPMASSASSYTIPQGIMVIENEAFAYCEKLTSVTIPDSVISIGDSAFIGCKKLTSVTLSYGVTTIGNHAFSHCISLSSMTIPASVTSIGDYAFASCWNLTQVTLPASVTSISDSAFSCCYGLKRIIVTRNSYAEKYCKQKNLPYGY